MNVKQRGVLAATVAITVFVLGYATAGYFLGIEGIYGWPAFLWVGALALGVVVAAAALIFAIGGVMFWISEGES